jgi:hypothetical protein
MEALKKKILVEGIILKVNTTGKTVADILESYTKLTEAEKTEIKQAIDEIK